MKKATSGIPKIIMQFALITLFFLEMGYMTAYAEKSGESKAVFYVR